MGFLENSIVNSTLSWVAVDDSRGQVTLTDNGSVKYNFVYTSGSDVGQCNEVWYSTGTLLPGEQKQYDLFNLSRSIFGGSIVTNLSGGSLKAIIVSNLNTGINQNIVYNTSGLAAFNQPMQTGAVYINIAPESNFIFSNKFGYPISTGQRYIYIKDINFSGVSYELAILGVSIL